jgi:hypothetical protein
VSLLDDAAAAWRSQEDREYVDAAHSEQKHQARAEAVSDASPEREEMSDEESREFAAGAWELLDVGITKFAGPGYALTAAEKARLLPVSARMAKKHLPADFSLADLEDLVPLEVVFVATVGLVYWPKHTAVTEAAAAAAAKKPEKEVAGEATRAIRAVP